MPNHQPRPGLQIAVIWIMAFAAELFIVARLVQRMRLVGVGAPPLGAMVLLLNVLALVVVPVAAIYLTRVLRRERTGAGSRRDRGD